MRWFILKSRRNKNLIKKSLISEFTDSLAKEECKLSEAIKNNQDISMQDRVLPSNNIELSPSKSLR